jgi:hypothetical protein
MYQPIAPRTHITLAMKTVIVPLDRSASGDLRSRAGEARTQDRMRDLSEPAK